MVKGKCVETLLWIRHLLLRLGLLVLTLIKVPIRIYNWSSDYTGSIIFVKAIPVLMICAVIFYPWYTFPLWIWLGLNAGFPLCYVVYALWWLMFVLCHIGVAVIGSSIR